VPSGSVCPPPPTVGVGHKPDAISSVSGIDGTSRNNKRLAGVTELCQVSAHRLEPHADDSRHILTNDPSGPDCFDNVAHCRPEMTVIRCASLLPGKGPRLAREAAREHVNGSVKASEVCALSNVSDVGHVGESFDKHSARVGFNLAESDGAESGPLGRECKASNSAEEIKVGESTHAAAPSALRPYSAINSASAIACVIARSGNISCARRFDTFLSPFVRHPRDRCHTAGDTHSNRMPSA
jgi:hypothetical protein